ncbi:DsbA family protein [Sulfuricystis multivorans]|uniref:DsbA family protein n=1 Tax=Sulfuricystis multivorans TaxID=2211108 RepID=UPI000F82272F|nr:DsbA family protein [Sulfuricystis multivorans]
MNPRTLVLVTAALLLSAFVAATALYHRAQADAATRRAIDHGDRLIRPHAPILGDVTAPVTIVEFFDPACATCQAFHEPLKALVAAHPGKLKLVLRYAPFQIGAEHIVALLEAARRQDKFWPVLDVLMETQDDWKPLHEAELPRVWKHLDGLELDLDRLRRDMSDPEIAARIQQDEEDANRLRIDTTPTFYVNGRPLPGFGFGVLQKTVEAALATLE